MARALVRRYHAGMLPTCHLYIAAMGRSGSTLLANMLTTPPERWILVEPWLPMGAKGKAVLEQLRRFGLEIEDAEWNQGLFGEVKEEVSARLERVYAGRLAGLARWGVKEVKADLHAPSLELLSPERVIVQVRDLRDVALSLVEKHSRNPDPRYDSDWMRDYIRTAAGAVLDVKEKLWGERCRVVQYEELVSSADERRALSEWLDWPLDGDVGTNLDLYGRAYERDIHGDALGQSRVARHERESNGVALAFAQEVAEEYADYQRAFGYT